MIIHGRAPRNAAGERFETDHATWRALLYVMHEAGGPVPAEFAESFRGLPDDAEARELADRLDAWLQTHSDNLFVRKTDEERLHPSGRFIGEPGTGETPGLPPRVRRQDVESFVGFVRASGGFEVETPAPAD